MDKEEAEKEMEKEEGSSSSCSWGTWEELVLACAVKRHGFTDWDSVASELHSKTSLLTTPHCCHQKYLDLHRRFSSSSTTATTPADNNNIPWLEHLRQLRVAELKQDLHRYDLSILSLQRKVKRLEEERETSLRPVQNDHDHTGGPIPPPDLPHDSSEKDKNDVPEAKVKDDLVSASAVADEDSDRENRSVNESNSTGSPEEKKDDGLAKLDAAAGGGGGEGVAEPVLSGGEESRELGCDSATQLSSDVQSSASLGRKKRRVGRRGEEDGGGGGGGGGNKGPTTGKSEPLISLIEMIRSHRYGSLFERRLEAQVRQPTYSLKEISSV